MRIERIRIPSYGRLAKLDTGDTPLPSLVVVRGENEAGKSTLFHALTTVLFGYSPARAEAHPYAPWPAGPRASAHSNSEGHPNADREKPPRGELTLEAKLVLDSGEPLQVTRSLRSRPTGRLEQGAFSEDLGNRALPEAERVGRRVFETIYAVSLDRLRQLDAASWERVLELLLTGLGADDLGSLREAIESFHREATARWRLDRRGKPQARRLQEDIRALEQRAAEAAQRERQKLQLHQRLQSVARELETQETERQNLRERYQQIRAFLPLREQRDAIDQALEAAGTDDDLTDLPADPAARRVEIEQQIHELEDLLRARRQRHHDLDAVIELNEADRTWLADADSVRTLQRALGRLPDLRREATERDEDLRSTEMDWRRNVAAAEASLDEARLFEQLQDDGAEIDVPPYSSAPTPRGWIFALLLAAVVAIAGLAFLVLGGNPWIAFALIGGGLVLSIGAFLAQHSWRRRERELEHARRAEWIENMRSLARRRAHSRERLASARATSDSEEEAVAQQLRRLGLVESTESPEHVLEAVNRRWTEVERREARAESAREAQTLVVSELHEIEGELAQRHRSRNELEDRLRALGDGEVERGVIVARERRAAAQTARQLESRLRQELPDAEERLRELSALEANGLRVSASELFDLEQRIDRCDRAREELRRQAQESELRLAAIAREESLISIASLLQRKRDHLTQTYRERDRSLLLASVLEEAERTFRESHQEDILERAGVVLSQLTGERYDRLLLAENGTRLLLFDEATRQRVPLEEPLSRGLRDQVFFALRLAIADHLDEGKECLPFLVDESLVNWDPERRARGIDLLREVARRRQVFFFTFDPVLHGLESEHTIDLSPLRTL